MPRISYYAPEELSVKSESESCRSWPLSGKFTKLDFSSSDEDSSCFIVLSGLLAAACRVLLQSWDTWFERLREACEFLWLLRRFLLLLII